MKMSEIKGLSDKELVEKIENEKDHLQKLVMNHAVSPLDNPLQIRKSRRTVARLVTQLRQRSQKI